MSPLEAIAECRKAHAIVGARWPAPLIAYLNQPLNIAKVYDWLCPCIGELLIRLGKSSDELQQALRLAQHQAASGVNQHEVEKNAESFWLRRATEGVAFTAVAQLFYAFSRLDHSNPNRLAGSASVPICLLEELESRKGEVLDFVVENFTAYVDHGVE